MQEIPLDERELLTEIAREDADPRVRRAAVAKLMDPAALAARRAETTPTSSVRAQAIAMLRDIALEAFEGLGEAESLAAVDALADTKTLVGIAKNASRESIGAARAGAGHRRARARIDRAARRARSRCAARRSSGCSDHGEILSVALNSEFKDPTLAAVDAITDRGELEQIAARAKNKTASKRARGILRETDERAAQERPRRRRGGGRARRRRSWPQAAARAAAEWAAERERAEADRGGEAETRRAPRRERRAPRSERARAEAAERDREQQAAGRAPPRDEQARGRARARRGRDGSGAREGGRRAASARLARAGRRSREAPRRSRTWRPRARSSASIRREWNDLAAGGAGEPDVALRVCRGRRRRSPRATPPRTKRISARGARR